MMNEPKRSISGFLNVDKPSAWTSSDVVAKLRSAFGLRQRKLKIGHGGTLDPLATGVLPICIGSATRFSEFLLGGTKSYRMTVRLGVETDTYDTEGSVVANRDFQQVTEDDLVETAAGFIGEIDQVPPMYSAIKRDGQPLYKLARRGITVVREPRKVTVSELKLTSWRPPDVVMEIECSSGFYARSLAHDIGQLLGCGAHMTALRRARSGNFSVTDSVPLEDLVNASEADAWLRYMLMADHVLKHFASVELDDAETRAFTFGQAIPFVKPTDDVIESTVRVYSKDGGFLGLALFDASTDVLRPKTVIASARMV